MFWDNAKVWGDAEVWGNAEVGGDAEVWGNAKLWGNSEVWDNAKLWGNAELWGNAKVRGNAEVYSASHVLVIGAIGSRRDFSTFYRNKDNGISVSCGCFNGSIEQFLEKVQKTHGDSHHAEVYKMAADLAKASIELDSKESDV